jgi:hypothetical protein
MREGGPRGLPKCQLFDSGGFLILLDDLFSGGFGKKRASNHGTGLSHCLRVEFLAFILHPKLMSLEVCRPLIRFRALSQAKPSGQTL